MNGDRSRAKLVHAWRYLVLSVLATSLATPPAAADSGESGNLCVWDLIGMSNCSSGTFTVATSFVTTVVDGCSGPGDTAQVRFDLDVFNTGNNRNDVGFFIALDGGSAQDGDLCYHDYLDPPVTQSPAYVDDTVTNGPWFDQDGDECGDMESNRRVIKTIPSESTTLTVACNDSDLDGYVDLEVCAGGRGTSGDLVCDSLDEAWPSSGAQCACYFVKLDVPVPATTTTLDPSVTTTTLSPTTTTTTLPELCNEVPRTGCQNAGPQGSRLILQRNISFPSRDKLLWTWDSSAAVSADDLGNPVLATSYDVCIYSGGANVLSSVVPTDGSCGDGSCWRETSSGYRYSGDRTDSEGIRVMQLASGAAGQARIVVRGKGPLLEMPDSVMLATPVLFQVVRRDAPSVCWEATFSTTLASNPERFKAQSD